MYRRNKHDDSCVSGGSGTISYQWQSSQMDQQDGPMQQGQVLNKQHLHLQVQ
jgi:hypothetical protein